MASCSKCGESLRVGEWPFCPHGEVKRVGIYGDEIDYVDHNLGPHPIRIRSKTQRRQLMAERGLSEAVRHVPHPAGSKQNHTVDWSFAADDYTMRYKRELLERAFRQRSDSPDGATMTPDIRLMSNEEIAPYMEKK